MNLLTQQQMLRAEAPGLIAWGIEHGWVTRPIWPPIYEKPQSLSLLQKEERKAYNKAFARRWRAANRAKGLTSAGTPRRRRPNGTVPKKSAYMAAVRHGTLPEFKKGKR